MKRTVLCLSLLLAMNIEAAEFGDATFLKLLRATKASALKDLNMMVPMCDYQELNCDTKASQIHFDKYGHQMPAMVVGSSVRLNRALYQELSRIEEKAVSLNKQNRKVKSYDLADDVRNTRWSSNPVKYTQGRYYSEEVRLNIIELFAYSKDIKGSQVAKTELKEFPYANSY